MCGGRTGNVVGVDDFKLSVASHSVSQRDPRTQPSQPFQLLSVRHVAASMCQPLPKVGTWPSYPHTPVKAPHTSVPVVSLTTHVHPTCACAPCIQPSALQTW